MNTLISPELLQEFKQLYAAQYGEELPDQEALERALSLLRLFRAIYKPIPAHKQDLYKNLGGCYKES